MASPARVSLPVQLQPISLTDDQLFFLAAMSLYAGRPHSHVHHEKIAQMNFAVHDAKLMWEVVRAMRKLQPNDGDVSNAHSDPRTDPGYKPTSPDREA